MLVCWICGSPEEHKGALCQPVLKLLFTTIVCNTDSLQHGDIWYEYSLNICVFIICLLSAADRSHLRLAAGVGSLKLASYGCHDYFTTEQFIAVALMAQV